MWELLHTLELTNFFTSVVRGSTDTLENIAVIFIEKCSDLPHEMKYEI